MKRRSPIGTRYAPSWAERFLKDIIKQDIWAGRGVGYIDSHGQDAEEILHAIPSWRADDVVYFNAADFA